MDPPNAYLTPGVPIPDPRNLPLNQYDARNVTGIRFLEIGSTFNTDDVNGLTGNAQPFHISVPIQDQLALFSYDPACSFRTITVGLESYSVRHFYNTVGGTGPLDGFTEIYREPIAIVCPQLQVNTASRFFTMLPNDFGQGLAGAAQVSFVDANFPRTLDFFVGLLNPIPRDGNLYNFNVNRLTVEPLWYSQYIRSLTLRLFVKVAFEPNRIPVVGLGNKNMISPYGGGGAGPAGPYASGFSSSGSAGGRAVKPQPKRSGGVSASAPVHMSAHHSSEGTEASGAVPLVPVSELVHDTPPVDGPELEAEVVPEASQLADGWTVGDGVEEAGTGLIRPSSFYGGSAILPSSFSGARNVVPAGAEQATDAEVLAWGARELLGRQDANRVLTVRPRTGVNLPDPVKGSLEVRRPGRPRRQ